MSYEAEYLNGQRNGKGKLYNYNGNLAYEGKFLNGQKHGKGKEYNMNGKLIFEGEYLYGYRNKGKSYINSKLEFEGEYLYDRKWNGKGYDKYGNIIYELQNGNGTIKEYDDNNGYLMYEDEYLNGKLNEN